MILKTANGAPQVAHRISPDCLVITPSEDDSVRITDVVRFLEQNEAGDRFSLVNQAMQKSVELPSFVIFALIELSKQFAKGNAVSIFSYQQELSTQRAADLLQVSRPYLIKLLEEGKIPYRKVGSHRRISLNDILEFKQRRDQERHDKLRELMRLTDELGLYDEPLSFAEDED